MNETVFSTFHSAIEELPLGGRISQISDRTIRIKLMLYPVAMPEVEDIHWDYGGPPTGREITAQYGDTSVFLTDDPFTIQVRYADGGVFKAFVDGILRKARCTTLRIPVGDDTRFYGLGGQFLGIEHSGKEIECESTDPWGEGRLRKPHWSNAYYPVPQLFTTEGYAVFFNSAVPVHFKFPTLGEQDRECQIQIASPALDMYVIKADNPIDAINEYYRITGRPYVPPKWGMEPLVGHASNHAGKCFNQKVMDDYIHNIVDDDFPNGIIFDEAWAWTLPEIGPDGDTRLWFHPETLGDFHIHNFDPEGSGIAQAHAAGQKYVLHITPYIGIRSTYSQELLDKGYLVMRTSDPSMPLVGQYHHYYLDFTNPDAVEWWKNGVRRLLALGADGFFNDFGESDDQRDALYMKGTGASFGQKYCIMNRKALWEVLQEVKGDDFYMITRAGWSGMHQYGGALIGDQAGDFEGMQVALSAMLSLSLSGQGIYAHNLGGYAGAQESTVFIRWVQLGVFSPMFTMWNSGPAGEPWAFDPETKDRYKEITRLRMRLLPYLHSSLHQYGETGVPMMCPMVMLKPSDASFAALEDQFMCGSELFVAPVFSHDGTVTFQLPDGEWLDFWTGEPVTGGCEVIAIHPINTLPVFVKKGGIVPMEVNPRRTEPDEAELEIHLYGTADNTFRVFDGVYADIKEIVCGDAVTITIDALKRPGLVLMGHGSPVPISAEFAGADGCRVDVPVVASEGIWRISTPASGGKLTFIYRG